MAVEDFTMYTETDPNSRFTVTATKVDIDGLSRDEDAYVYKDKGVGHFELSFEHQFAITVRENSNDRAQTVMWAVSNVVDDEYYWNQNNSQALAIYFWEGNSPGAGRFSVRNEEAGTVDTTQHDGGMGEPTTDTTYYFSVRYQAYTGSYNKVVCRIYSDAAQTTLLDTLRLEDIPIGRTYRYVFAAGSSDNDLADVGSLDVEDLDLDPTPDYTTYSRTTDDGARVLYGHDAEPPDGDDTWPNGSYSAYGYDDKAEMADLNQVTVDLANEYQEPSGPWKKAWMCFGLPTTEAEFTQTATITWYLNMEDGGSESTALYVYNYDASEWELQDSHTGGAPGSYTLSVQLSDDANQYRSVSGYIAALLCSTVAGGVSIRVDEAYAVTLNPPVYEEELSQSLVVESIVTDVQSYVQTLSQTILITSTVTELGAPEDHVTQTIRVLSSVVDHQVFAAENLAETLSIVSAVEDMKFYATENLSSTIKIESEVADCVLEALESVITIESAVTDEWIRTEDLVEIIAIQSAVSDTRTYDDENLTETITIESTVAEEWVRTDDLTQIVCIESTVTDEVLYIEDLTQTISIESEVSDIAAYTEALVQTILIDSAVIGLHVLPLYLGVTASGSPELSWDSSLPAGTVYWIIADGNVIHRTTSKRWAVPGGTEIRQWLMVIGDPDMALDDVLPWLDTPRDVVRCTWTESSDARVYRLYRKPSGGAYSLIATQVTRLYDDPPWGGLQDGNYTYQVRAVDKEGDQGISLGKTAIVSSAPEPPTGIALSWDSETKTATVTWTGSGSSDIDVYRVRSSAGENRLLLAGEPVQESGETTYQEVFDAGDSGLWVIHVRSVDADGYEDGNVDQVVALALSAGGQTARPAPPRLVEVTSVVGGRLKVEWLYEPADEQGGPGAAYEARLYWDNGTGTVDYAEPHVTVAMGNPMSVARYSWESVPLVNETTYTFVVRIATAAWPDGIESQNTDEHSATADSDQPEAPVLTVALLDRFPAT